MTTDINQTSTKPTKIAVGDSDKGTTPKQEDPNSSLPDKTPMTLFANTERRRTLTFVVGAALCLAITTAFEWSTHPTPISDFGKVGQAFYPQFTDPTVATSLAVYLFDTEKVRPIDFLVQKTVNGRWVIPSHHNYPADAQDQLAKTAASVIGIRRGAMVTRWKTDHASFGVVNPKQEMASVGDIEGMGGRLILRGANSAVLADYIFGNQVENSLDQYYVRHPNEDEVYLAKLRLNLSTNFIDWIETDLLDVDSNRIIRMTINDYSIDELQGHVTEQHISTLTREQPTDPWTLDGLIEETEQINEDAIRETVQIIADLQIAGVRPKQPGLTPELQLDRQTMSSQQDVMHLQTDLLARGFLLRPSEDGDQEHLRLLAHEGEIYAATNEGMVYHLHFGRAFAGTGEELEIGFSSESKDKDMDVSEGNDTATANDYVEEVDNTGKPGRYVFVRVEFDEKLLGNVPREPVKPERPAELTNLPDQSQNVEMNDNSTTHVTSENQEEDPRADLRKQYEDALQNYDGELKAYEHQLQDFENRMKAGQKKSEQLNRRFADWYYVIPGDSFDKLRLDRTNLVNAKEK